MATNATILSQLESHLWEAANILRGPVDAADFKTYVFPLLFFKRISDVYDEERYGFDLVRSLAETDGMVTSEGTIYPLLSRLRRDGLVETTWRESSSGPPRRYYRLTKLGRTALDGFKDEWGRFRDAVDHFVERKAV